MSGHKFYGIDIGGTTVKLGLFTENGLVQKWEILTDRREKGRHILRHIASSLPGPAQGAALGVPGAVLSDGTVS